MVGLAKNGLSMIPNQPILIIDDEERIRELLKDTLKSKGFSVITARNGISGLRKFESEDPCLIITDVMLPQMDGFSLVQKIRKHKGGKDIPIIMMSAVFRDLEVQEDAKTKYGTEFLVKPFSLLDLIQLLESYNLVVPEGEESSDPSEAEGEKKPAKGMVQDTIRGELEHFSLPIILVSFFSEAKTGQLFLKRGNQVIKMYLDKGVPIYGEGRLPAKNREEVAKVLRGSFGWNQGVYQFKPLDSLPGDIPKYQYEFYEIIYEGAKRYYRLDLLIGKLQKFQQHRVVSLKGFKEKIQKVPFGDQEKEIIDQIDGQKTVTDLVTVGSHRIENLFQILWILHFMNVIDFQA